MHPLFHIIQEISITNEVVPPSPHTLGAKSARDILTMQLDIIYMLVRAGADPQQKDNAGRTPSFRACRQLEINFIEGSLLLGMFGVWGYSQTSVI